MSSLLYYINANADRSGGLTQKYQRLLKAAPLDRLFKPGDHVAVKMHLGEPGNGRYLRPIFAVLLVDRLKELGTRPFITDTAVLYKSPRGNAYDYYTVARRNGFTPEGFRLSVGHFRRFERPIGENYHRGSFAAD